jgi:hypothetical protein
MMGIGTIRRRLEPEARSHPETEQRSFPPVNPRIIASALTSSMPR